MKNSMLVTSSLLVFLLGITAEAYGPFNLKGTSIDQSNQFCSDNDKTAVQKLEAQRELDEALRRKTGPCAYEGGYIQTTDHATLIQNLGTDGCKLSLTLTAHCM